MFEIYTLGNFDIRHNGESILSTRGYPYKTLKLFKYFLTHEGKRLLPENIIEDIWQDNEYRDPGGALRTQISRVRKMLELDKPGEDFFQINHINGYYVFKLDEKSILDSKVFENKVKEIDTSKATDLNEDELIETISLYKGSYLQELEDEDWIIPIRSRFDRLYVKTLDFILRKLIEKRKYHNVISICEEAMKYKFYEEMIHIYFLKALIGIGQEKYATSHYEYYTSRFYQEMRIVPSNKSKEIYKLLQNKKEKKDQQILDLDIIKTILKEDMTEGALMCDFEYFKFLYNFEFRNAERNKDKNIHLLILTIDNLGYQALKEEELKEEMGLVKNVVFNMLRKGDVLSQWNDSQLVILLYNIDEEENLENVIDRIIKKHNDERRNHKILINIKCKKIINI